MTYYGWERGTLTLPPAATRKIRDRLNAYLTKRNERAAAAIDAFFEKKGSGGRTQDTFKAVLQEWDEEQRKQIRRLERGGYGGGFTVATPESTMAYDAHDEAYQFLSNRLWSGNFGRPLKRDVNRAFPKPPTARKATYDLNGEASIVFDGNRMTWHVPENNHAVERAREHPLGKTLFEELERVEWTRGTGGKIIGNDEYNRDTQYEGGGANYATGRYGPLGDPHFVTKEQQRSLERSAAQWRQKPGNAGKCGMRTMLNGKRTGPPCKNPAYSCPIHRRRY